MKAVVSRGSRTKKKVGDVVMVHCGTLEIMALNGFGGLSYQRIADLRYGICR